MDYNRALENWRKRLPAIITNVFGPKSQRISTICYLFMKINNKNLRKPKKKSN